MSLRPFSFACLLCMLRQTNIQTDLQKDKKVYATFNIEPMSTDELERDVGLKIVQRAE